MRVVARTIRGDYEDVLNGNDGNLNKSCLYLHRDRDIVGAFSNCHGEDFVGINQVNMIAIRSLLKCCVFCRRWELF